jgi:flagellar biosynthesis/type III secretory pathway protein FliH
MSSIIKSADLSGLSTVQSLGEPLSVAPVISLGKHDEKRDAILRRVARLEEELRQRDAEVRDLRAAVAQAQEEGAEQGYESGLVAAQDRQTERLALLEKSMMRAQASLAEGLTSLSRLSALLAQDCVDIVLGNAGDRAELIERIIVSQMAKIDRAMLVDIRLSRLDFPDQADLASLADRLGAQSFSIVAGDDLPSGGCVMTLRLGRLSVGIDQQWPALRNLLDEMALPEAGG